MKKLALITLLIVLLSACSLPGRSSAPVTKPIPTSTPTATATQTPKPSATWLPTLRSTPTDIFAYLTLTPGYVPPVLLNVKTATPLPVLITTIIPGPGFKSVRITDFKIYWGICKPRTSLMTVEVQDPETVARIYLFMRLASQKTIGDTTPWVGTVLDKHPNGTFTYLLRANLIDDRKNYTKAWVQFEFAAADKNDVVLSRSQIYTRSITLAPCP